MIREVEERETRMTHAIRSRSIYRVFLYKFVRKIRFEKKKNEKRNKREKEKKNFFFKFRSDEKMARKSSEKFPV